METLQIGMHWSRSQIGGADRYVQGLVNGLNALGVVSQGLVFSEEKPDCDHLESLGSPERALLRRAHEVRRGVDRRLADSRGNTVIGSHFALYGFSAGSKLSGLPHVVHFHGPWADEGEFEGNGRLLVFLKRRLERSFYRTGRQFIALSAAFAELLARTYRVPPEKIHVIPPGIHLGSKAVLPGREASRMRMGWPSGVPIILCVRRLTRRMGLETLIEAFGQIGTRHPEVLLMIAGCGHMDQALERRIDELGLGRRVRLLGFVPEDQLSFAYQAADFSIVPSAALEGFGLVTLESLAAGTPVLVTPVGGLPEAVAGLDPRLVLASASRHGVEQGLDAALSNLNRLPAAEACRSYVMKGFDWAAITPRILKVYEAAAAARS